MTELAQRLTEKLESDIAEFESMAAFFETVREVESMDGRKTSGKDYAKRFRDHATSHRELIQRIKTDWNS